MVLTMLDDQMLLKRTFIFQFCLANIARKTGYYRVHLSFITHAANVMPCEM
jgi:hypothetical protein